MRLEEVKSKTTTGLVVLSLRMVFMRLVGFAGSVILARILAPAEFGIFATVSSIILFFTVFRDVGLSSALIQQQGDLEEDEVRTTFTLQQILVLVCVSVVYISAGYIARFYKSPDSTAWLIRVMSISLMMDSLKSVPGALLERRLYFDRLAMVDIVEQLAYYTVAVGLAVSGFGVWSLIWATLLRSFSGLVVLYILSPWRVSLGINRQVARGFFAFGVPMQGIAIVALLKDNMIPLLGGLIYGATAVGYLNWAWNVSHYVGFIVSNLSRMMFPSYSRVQTNGVHLGVIIERNLRISFLSSFPAAMAIMALAPDIIHYIYTDKWLPGLPALYFLCINSIGGAVSNTFFFVLPAVGKSKRALEIMLIWTVTCWVLIWPTMTLFGFVGFAINYAVIIILADLWLYREIRREIAKIDLWGNMRGPFLAAITTGLTIHWLRPYLVHSLVTLFLAGVASLALFVLVLFLIEGERLVGEIRTVISLGVGQARALHEARWGKVRT
jgi:O-antigen/teichoic acid export membrane protein